MPGADPLPPAPDAGSVAQLAVPLKGAGDWDALVGAVGAAQMVLLGESTHGTSEFYEARAEITRRLVDEKGFNCVVVEAEWPEMQRVGRYVRGDDRDTSARAALADVTDFPLWMWRNEPTAALIEWLRQHNDGVSALHRAGQWSRDKCQWFGMDVRSVPECCDQVLAYLEQVDPVYRSEVERRYSVLLKYRDDMSAYGAAVARGELQRHEEAIRTSLERTLAEIQRNSRSEWEWLACPADHFNAEQCAEVVVNGEEYYRKRETEPGAFVTWNTRDQHMVQTLLRLQQQLPGMSRSGTTPKIVVWAHNSHVGDSRATDRGRAASAAQQEPSHMANQEWNLGHMARETFGRDQVFIVGFSTAVGTVSAASSWGGQVGCYKLRPPQPGTQEEALAAVAAEVAKLSGAPNYYLLFASAAGAERERRLSRLLGTHARTQRMIGVVYRPDCEEQSHFVQVQLPEQVDAMVHFQTTAAVRPLDPPAEWVAALARGGL